MGMGLLATNTLTPYRSMNSRRKIFYQFPTGAAPLMGLLSMLPQEDTDKSEFGWWERRFPVLRTTTATSGIVFQNGDGSALTDGGSGVTLTADTEYRAVVVATDQFKATHVAEFRDLDNQSAKVTVRGTVTAIISATVLKFRPYTTQAGIKNASTNNTTRTVAIIGTANQEGARSGSGTIQFPVNPTNFTQIFRTAFNITRTALKEGLLYDKSGPYKNMAWENGLRHLVEMEKAFIFGEKHTVNVVDSETGDTTPETVTGGAIWFLAQWEAANSLYRGGTGAPAVTLNTDDNKRIIDLGGVMSSDQYRTYISRLFRKTNDKAYEKLCLCGGTFLEVVNKLFEREIVRNVGVVNKERGWEFIVHSHTTLRGTVHYKVHPLFDEDPGLQGNALFLDLGNLKYRPLTDSDTVFLKGRQANDRDSRKDEWITEAGLEMRFPESCMYMLNVLQAA